MLNLQPIFMRKHQCQENVSGEKFKIFLSESAALNRWTVQWFYHYPSDLTSPFLVKVGNWFLQRIKKANHRIHHISLFSIRGIIPWSLQRAFRSFIRTMPHNEKEKLLLPTGKNNNPTVFSNVHEKCQQSTNQVQKRYRNGFVSKKMYEKSITRFFFIRMVNIFPRLDILKFFGKMSLEYS